MKNYRSRLHSGIEMEKCLIFKNIILSNRYENVYYDSIETVKLQKQILFSLYLIKLYLEDIVNYF